jgi:cytochrome c biogenesis protein CcmG, thiol:disulfide interchange protein DsbE
MTQSNGDLTEPASRLWALVPIGLFFGLIALFAWAMFGQRVDRHASPLIGKTAPNFILPDMKGQTLDLSSYRGKPVILNFYASWCAPCRIEHPQFLQLSKDSRFVVLGVAYRDDPAKTAAYLDELGDPFVQTAIDRQGSIGVQFGLAGVPETYVIGADGKILLRHQGEVTAKVSGELARLATTNGMR